MEEKYHLIYENALSCEADIADFILEGNAKISFENGRMRMENARSETEGQKANYVFWCDRIFPEEMVVTWEFRPIREPGLAMLFFAARGRNGEDLFSDKLAVRTGEYPQYHHGDIDAFHVSYFRRKEPEERCFHTCNLRKSYGFYLVAQGADPIPDVADVAGAYQLMIKKSRTQAEFFVNGLRVFSFTDDGKTYGDLLGAGRIGFRQLAPMIGEYANLRVYA